MAGDPGDLRALLVEQFGGAAVQAGPLGGGEPAEDGPAGDRVAEPAAVQQPGDLERVGGAGHRLRGLLDQPGEEFAAARLLVQDGERLGEPGQHRPAPVQAADHGVAVRLADDEFGLALRGGRGGRALVLQQGAHQQRVAAADRVAPAAERAGGRLAQLLGDQRGDPGRSEPLQRDPAVAGLAQQLGVQLRVGRDGERALGEQQGDPGVAQPGQQPHQPVQREGVGELDVVHADQHRRALGGLGQFDGAPVQFVRPRQVERLHPGRAEQLVEHSAR